MTTVGSPQSTAIASGNSARRVTNRLHDEFPGSQQPVSYYPLALGNRWQYVSSNTVTVESGADVTESREHEEVLAVEPHDLGGVCATVAHRMRLEGQEHAFQTRLRANDMEVADLDAHTVYLQGPLQTGARWSWNDDNDNLHISEVGGPETVEVPAGRFAGCIRVSESFQTRQGRVVGSRTDWYAPGVGRVKSAFLHDSEGHGSFEEKRELVRFDVRQGRMLRRRK